MCSFAFYFFLAEKIPNIFACQVRIDKVCPDYESRDWVYEMPGTVIKVSLLSIHGRRKLMPFLNTTVITQSQSVEGNLQYDYVSTPKYGLSPDELPFPISPDVPADKFEYDDYDRYNRTVVLDSGGKEWIDLTFFYDSDHRRTTHNVPICCLLFFLISLILLCLIVAAILAIFYKHRKHFKRN